MHKILKYYCQNFLFVWLTIVSANAQQYNFRNYSVNEGLAQSQVYALCEDNRHNLWIGTRGGGVNRFDGLHFQRYTEEEGLVNNFVRCILQDSSGNLWFGTDNGLSRYDGIKFTSFCEKEGLKNCVINDLCLDFKKRLLIATEKGVFLFDKGVFTPVRQTQQIPAGRITSIYCDKNGIIWLGTHYGIYILSPTPDKFKITHLDKNDGLAHNDVTGIEGDEEGVWISTYDGGVSHYNGQRFFNLKMSDGLLRNSVYGLYCAGNKQLWLAGSAGVTVIDYHKFQKDSLRFTYYTEDNGLCNNVTRCFLKDSFGSVWIGSSGGGMSRLDSWKFTHFLPEKEVLGDLVFSIIKDNKGTVWLASSEGGVTLFDGKSLKRVGQKERFTSGKVKCMYKMPDGTIWLGTTGHGAFHYDGKRFRHYGAKEGLCSQFISAIAYDRRGRVWFATSGGGACYFNPVTQRFVRPGIKLPSNRINTVFVDKADNIWFGTLNAGAYKINAFDKTPDRFEHFPSPSLISTPENVRCIAEDTQGRLFIGTAGRGVLVYNGKTFTPLSGQDVLPSANIYFIHVDKWGRIWIGSEKGITRFNLQSDLSMSNVRHYAQSSGLPGIEATHNGVYEEESGSLWFGTISGATLFNPEKEFSSLQAPFLQLTGIHLFFDRIENTSFAKDLGSWYPIPGSLELPFDKNSLSFEFTGVDLSAPESVRYTWQLEGFDKEWSPVTSRHEAVYSNLPPGQYIFKIKAQNDEGLWTEKPLAYSFKILPPFWATFWFRLLMVFLVFGTLFLFYRLRIRNIQKRNAAEKLKLETEKTLLELEQKALYLQMNPHFLFNCLNSIKGLIAEEKPEEAKLYLSRFARLMRSILDSSRTNSHSLAQETELLQHYVQLEKLSRDNAFELEIQMENIAHPDALLIPSMIIQPFVENAILHGLSSRKEGGIILLTFKKDGTYLQCIIEDNGIGREESDKKKLTSLDKHESVAMEVISERLSILTHLKDPVTITDLKTSDGEALGTRVELILNYEETQ